MSRLTKLETFKETILTMLRGLIIRKLTMRAKTQMSLPSQRPSPHSIGGKVELIYVIEWRQSASSDNLPQLCELPARVAELGRRR